MKAFKYLIRAGTRIKVDGQWSVTLVDLRYTEEERIGKDAHHTLFRQGHRIVRVAKKSVEIISVQAIHRFVDTPVLVPVVGKEISRG